MCLHVALFFFICWAAHLASPFTTVYTLQDGMFSLIISLIISFPCFFLLSYTHTHKKKN